MRLIIEGTTTELAELMQQLQRGPNEIRVVTASPSAAEFARLLVADRPFGDIFELMLPHLRATEHFMSRDQLCAATGLDDGQKVAGAMSGIKRTAQRIEGFDPKLHLQPGEQYLETRRVDGQWEYRLPPEFRAALDGSD